MPLTSKITPRSLARAGVIGAAYVALTYLAGLANLAYGPVQFRFSEALTVLPFLFPEAVPGLFVGCVVSNLLSPYGALDLVIGSLATLLAAVWTARCGKRWFAPLPPVVCNAALVGAMLAWYEAGFGAGFPLAFAYNALTVGAGELVVCYALGLPLLRVLERPLSQPAADRSPEGGAKPSQALCASSPKGGAKPLASPSGGGVTSEASDGEGV